MKKYSHESGQIVLITLLVLSIAATVALSLIARTTTDVTMSSQVEESARAFNAAEAGIEQALKLGVGTAGPQVLIPGVNYDVTVASIGGAAGVFTVPRRTPRSTTETVWLVDHNPDGTLDETPTFTAPLLSLCWSQESTIPAVVTTILYKRGASYYVAKGAYDPDSIRATTNNFSGVTALSGGCGSSGMYGQTVTFADFGINPAVDILLMLRVRPVYADTQLAVDASIPLPLQGNRIESLGTTETGVTREIIVYQQYRSAPTLFDAALYSQNSLSK
jgi:type II secretory pathway pseudopilin PulG